jgi:hypothetical protein
MLDGCRVANPALRTRLFATFRTAFDKALDSTDRQTDARGVAGDVTRGAREMAFGLRDRCCGRATSLIALWRRGSEKVRRSLTLSGSLPRIGAWQRE